MRWLLLGTGLAVMTCGWSFSSPLAQASESDTLVCHRIWSSCGPQYLVFAADGSIFVANGCGRVTHYDSTGVELNHWSGSPGDSELPYLPSGIDLDGAGNVLVASLFGKLVEKFTPDGTLLATFGVGTLDKPTGIAVDRGTGHFFVCEGGVGVIREYDGAGTWLRDLAVGYYVIDLALGPNGDLYVSYHNGRVSRLDHDGNPLATWAAPDQGPGTDFRGIAVSPDGNVHVAYRSSGRVLTLSPDLHYLRDWSVACFGPYREFYGIDFNGQGQAVLSQPTGLGEIGLFDPETTTPVARTTWGRLKTIYH